MKYEDRNMRILLYLDESSYFKLQPCSVLLRLVFFSARNDSYWTAKRSHRVAGGRARFLRAAPGRHPTTNVRTLKGCNRNVREPHPRCYLTVRTLVRYQLLSNSSFLLKSICVTLLLHPFRVHGVGFRKPGAARKKRALPPATLCDAFGVSLNVPP